MKRIALGLLASLVLAGGCSSSPVDVTSKVVEVPAQSFTKLWSLDLTDRGEKKKYNVEWVRNFPDQLVVFKGDRNAYVVDKRGGTLTAIDPISGPGPVLPPFTNGKRIGYPVATQVEVFDQLGNKVSTVGFDVSLATTATFSPTTFYIGVAGLHGGRVQALDPNRKYNTPVWELLVFGAIQSTPVFYVDALYFATRDGHVYAINEKREPIWPLDKGYFECGPVTADITVDDTGVYVPSLDTKLICLNRSTGKVKWEYYAQYPLSNPAAVTDETVYLNIGGQGLVALDKVNGDYHRKALWTNHEAVKLLSEDAKYAYVQLQNNAIGALDRKTGAIAFRSPATPIDFFVTNIAKDGIIYGVTKAGLVVSVKPVTAPGTMGSLIFTK